MDFMLISDRNAWKPLNEREKIFRQAQPYRYFGLRDSHHSRHMLFFGPQGIIVLSVGPVADCALACGRKSQIHMALMAMGNTRHQRKETHHEKVCHLHPKVRSRPHRPVAVALAAQTANATCVAWFHQPDEPKDLERFKKQALVGQSSSPHCSTRRGYDSLEAEQLRST